MSEIPAKPKAPAPAVPKSSPLTNPPFLNDDDRLFRLAERIKGSSVVPKDYIGKPENIFVAMMYGREIGLHPIQAVQSIMVVNGRPTLWGDAIPGLVQASGLLEKFEENWDESTKTATCIVRRKGDQKDHTVTFSLAEATKAGLTNKDTWKNYPKRMCAMRARAFAFRDRFSDVLKGLAVREEVEDYQILEGAPQEPLKVPAAVTEAEVVTTATPSTEEPAPQPAVDPARERLGRARENFKATYGLSAGTLSAWQTAKNFPAPSDEVAELSRLWLAIKSGKTTVEKEFGPFVPAETDAIEGSDDDLFEKQ